MLKELAPLQRGPFRTADRSAVNPRGFHRDKEMPVESRISRHDRLIALVAIQSHMAKLVWNWGIVSPFSDMKMEEVRSCKSSGVATSEELDVVERRRSVPLCSFKTEQTETVRLPIEPTG